MDKKAVILSLFLLTILMGQAVAIPIIVPIIAGAVAGGALGFLIGEHYNKWLEPETTYDPNIDYVNYKTALINNAKTHKYMMTTYKNLAEYVKYYALARAKAIYAIEVAKGLNNTTDPNSVLNDVLSSAMTQAVDKATETIDNASKGLIEYWKDYVYTLALLLNAYIKTCRDLDKDTGLSPDNPSNSIEYGSKDSLFGEYTTLIYDGVEIDHLTLDGLELYNLSEFEEIICKLEDDRSFVENNLYTYFEEVNQKILEGELNITELASEVVDPYALLTMAQNDSANSLVWAQYSLALMGLQTNTTAPVTVKIGNETYDGYIFTSYPTTFEVGHNYTVPNDQAVFILTSDGKLVTLQPGDSFELVRAVDEKTGEELTNLTMRQYTPSSFDPTQYNQELKELIELQKELLDKLTTTGGGGGSLTDWWNSLDTTTQLLIIGGGIVVLIVLARRGK